MLLPDAAFVCVHLRLDHCTGTVRKFLLWGHRDWSRLVWSANDGKLFGPILLARTEVTQLHGF